MAKKPGVGQRKDKKTNIEASQLTEFFSLLSEPLKVVQHRSLSFDPWEVAGLGRKEVRNTAVLSWLLDPEGTHGFGRLPLQAFLRAIRHSRNDIPEDYLHYCRVQVETNPTGENSNRVDIEIDADNFFLLIEVKIDAYEQPEQVARYCSDAKLRAMSRPWAVIFNASWRKTADLWLRFQTRVCSLYFLATSRLSFRVFVATALQRFHFCQ